MVAVVLGPEHIEFSDNIARRRQASALRHGRPAHNGAPAGDTAALDIHIHGARGECAAYLLLKPIEWHAYQETGLARLPDLGSFIDVKTRRKDWHDLIVQKDDPPEWAYVLVIDAAHPRYELRGWLWGYEAKQPEYLIDPAKGREAYFVPAHALRPIEVLIDLLHWNA